MENDSHRAGNDGKVYEFALRVTTNGWDQVKDSLVTPTGTTTPCMFGYNYVGLGVSNTIRGAVETQASAKG
jgi:hypothetical protein